MALAAPIRVVPPCFPFLCHPKRSALRCRMQRIAMTDAVRCVGRCSVLRFPSHSKAVLREGFLSIPSLGFLPPPLPLGKLRSMPLVARFSAFFCASQRIQSCEPAHPFARTNGVAGVGDRCGNDVGMGLWNLGLWAVGARLAGSGKSTGALKKEAQQAGLTNLLRLLERRDRDSNPGYSHPYAAFRVRSIRPLWHLSSSGCAALPVPCACRRWAGL